MRMIYLDNDQTDLYEHLFNEKLTGVQSQSPKKSDIEESKEDYSKEALFALFIRGVDAIAKCEKIIGHFNPQSARATNEKSMRAFFGVDKNHNCTLKMFAS
jgi:nucleoside diphosphate kinase